jgi:hypothetical protein
MTIPDSHESASDETGRPAETSDPSVAQEGWAVDGFLYDAFISYSRRDLDASDKIEPDLESFPLPREIRKRLGRRNLNVFRDISDMTGNRWRFPSAAMNRGWRWRTATWPRSGI